MITVLIDDLAHVVADAIVRPATTGLAPAAPIAERLDATVGEVSDALDTIRDRLDPGAAVVTVARNLGVELIIHTVVKADAGQVTPISLRRALQSALERAVQFDVAHLAIPPIGVGPDELTLETVAQSTVEVLRQHLLVASYPEKVSIVVQSDEERAVFDQAIRAYGAAG